MSTVDELRAKVKVTGPWFVVPAGTPETDCSRCDADGLYWTITKSRAKMLVDCNVPYGEMPSEHTTAEYESLDFDFKGRSGRGVAHFATCPAAAEFRNSKRPPLPK